MEVVPRCYLPSNAELHGLQIFEQPLSLLMVQSFFLFFLVQKLLIANAGPYKVFQISNQEICYENVLTFSTFKMKTK